MGNETTYTFDEPKKTNPGQNVASNVIGFGLTYRKIT